MIYKIILVTIEAIFPRSHLQVFLKKISFIEFNIKLTPRVQHHDNMFYPFYYKDPFVHDCIFEIKERNSNDATRLFGKILSQWVIKKINEINALTILNYSSDKISFESDSIFYLVPVPQHISKTKEKGFCHTTSLAQSIEVIVKNKYPHIPISLFPCVKKIRKTKKLHDTQGKIKRFSLIKKTMQASVTKEDAKQAYFFIIDDVYTTGATFKEVRRSLSDCVVPTEHMFFISIAH